MMVGYRVDLGASRLGTGSRARQWHATTLAIARAEVSYLEVVERQRGVDWEVQEVALLEVVVMQEVGSLVAGPKAEVPATQADVKKLERQGNNSPLKGYITCIQTSCK